MGMTLDPAEYKGTVYFLPLNISFVLLPKSLFLLRAFHFAEMFLELE